MKHIGSAIVLSSFLAACGNMAGTPGGGTNPGGNDPAYTLTASTPSVEVGKTATLTLKQGTADVTTGVTYSVTPNDGSVSVSNTGVVTVNHLSPTDVTITASVSGKTATTTLKTYGLDIVGGTIDNNGTLYLARIRNMDGTVPTLGGTLSSLTVAKPGSATAREIFPDTNGQIERYPRSQPEIARMAAAANGKWAQAYAFDFSGAPVAGNYTAVAKVGTTTFTKTFTVSAASKLPAAPTVTTFTPKANGFDVAGTLPAGTELSRVVLVGTFPQIPTVRAFHSTNAATSWSYTFNADEIADLRTASGEATSPRKFTAYFNAFSFNFLDPTKALPNQVNVTTVGFGDKDFPF